MQSAVELREAFLARERSPVELIDQVDTHPELGAFVTLDLENARTQAMHAEAAYRRGEARPLEGLTLGVKDLFDTAGMRTTYGSRIFDGHVPARDAWAVKRAKDAGAIVVGKTLTHEFAWGITTVNSHFPPCRNPYDLGPCSRRQQWRFGGRARHGADRARAGQRHGRQHPHPRRASAACPA